jgi:integrase
MVADATVTTVPFFRRDVIGAATANMPTRSTSAMGRRRSILLRIGEALGVIEIPHPLPRLAASEPTAPYAEDEVLELRAWAHNQRDSSYRASARALLALGMGAGLPTRDICEVRVEHVLAAGSFIIVAGNNPRLVPVLPTWTEDLVELTATSQTGVLFRPGTRWHKNIVTVFAARSTGAKIRPSTQRMRASWLVHHLAEGMPMQDLLHAAGLASMDALVRYQRFLPAQSLAARLDTTALPSLESVSPSPRHRSRR